MVIANGDIIETQIFDLKFRRDLAKNSWVPITLIFDFTNRKVTLKRLNSTNSIISSSSNMPEGVTLKELIFSCDQDINGLGYAIDDYRFEKLIGG